MIRRAGVTLVEVLVAIMITGIGLLALLTLFPLGALEMAQSIEDDRAGHIKRNAYAAVNIWNITNDPNVTNAMLNPTPGGPLPPMNPTDPAQVNSPSYPVFVDPNGWWANAGNPAWQNWQNWMAGQQGIVPKRVTYSLLSPTSPDPYWNTGPPGGPPAALYQVQQRLRWTTFLDDMSFPRDDPSGVPEGRPCIPSLGPVDRAPRYSWAYLLRQTKIGYPNLPVETWAIIYSGRAWNMPTTGEHAFNAVFGANGANVITLSWGPGTLNPTAPDIVNGRWIFDATMQPKPHGFPYRVINVTQTSATTMDVEVQGNLLGTGNGVAVILDNVIYASKRS